jgi:hypothetical protein
MLPTWGLYLDQLLWKRYAMISNLLCNQSLSKRQTAILYKTNTSKVRLSYDDNRSVWMLHQLPTALNVQ